MAGRGEHDARLGRVVQIKKRAEEIRSFELSGKEFFIIFYNYDKTKSKEGKNKRTGAKRRHIVGRAYDTGRGGSKATSKWQ